MWTPTATRSSRRSRWRSRPSTSASGLYQEYQAGTAADAKLNVQSIVDPNREDYNVIAESKGGNPNTRLVVDAHLDAIYGAGMLDNASGSATILDIAEQMRKVNPRNKLRFIWFGGEELGAARARRSTSTTSADRAGATSATTSMRTSPRRRTTSWAVLDPAAVDLFGRTVRRRSRANVYAPSHGRSRPGASTTSTRSAKTTSSSRRSAPTRSTSTWRAFPASGVLTGQDCCKTQEEVNLFGGFTGNFEGNVAELRRRMRRQPVPLVRQPQQQRPERADVHVQGVRQHRRADGVRQEHGGGKRYTSQAIEGEAQARSRYGRRPARHPVTPTGRGAAQQLRGAASACASRSR